MTAIRAGRLTFGTGEVLICVPITGSTRERIREQAERIKAEAPDLAEWRGDFFEEIGSIRAAQDMAAEISEILGDIPLLFTFRTKKEGGNQDLSAEEYCLLNEQMADCPDITLIDTEVCTDPDRMRQLIGILHKKGKVVIGSHHRFYATPTKEEMRCVFKTIEEAGADILKLAVMPRTEEDADLLCQATKEALAEDVSHPIISMSMGELGIKTRIEGRRFGSSMTFACVGEASAPGQLEIGELRKIMNYV